MNLVLGVAQRCAAGEVECGDAHAFVSAGNCLLLAVIDGLGHGPEAHRASEVARRVVQAQPCVGVGALLRRLDDELRNTRGAAVSVLEIDTDRQRLVFGGVGNVEVLAVSRDPVRPIPCPGIIGRRVRKVSTSEFSIAPGDRLVVFTDGISRRVRIGNYGHLDAQHTADAILAEHGVRHDDATCLVVDLVDDTASFA